MANAPGNIMKKLNEIVELLQELVAILKASKGVEEIEQIETAPIIKKSLPNKGYNNDGSRGKR